MHYKIWIVLTSLFLYVSCSSSTSAKAEENGSESGTSCTKSILQQDTSTPEAIFNINDSENPAFSRQLASFQLAGILGDTAILVDVQAPEIFEVTASGVTTQVLSPANATEYARDLSVIKVNAKANEEAIVWAQEGEVFTFDRHAKTMRLLVAKSDSFGIRDVAVYGGFAYFNGAQKGETAEHMWRIPISGGEPQIIIDAFMAWDWDMAENGHIYFNDNKLLEYNPDGSLYATLTPDIYVSQAEVNGNTIAYRSSRGYNYVANITSPTELLKILDFSDDLYGFIADGNDFFADYSFKLLHANPITGICKEYTNIYSSEMIPRNNRLWINTGSKLMILPY